MPLTEVAHQRIVGHSDHGALVDEGMIAAVAAVMALAFDVAHYHEDRVEENEMVEQHEVYPHDSEI
jgi:hypothetical protein